MHIRIWYTDKEVETYEGDYGVYDNYISIKILTTHNEKFPWYKLIIPMHTIKTFEAHP